MAERVEDPWAAWVLERRFGDDPDQAEQAMRHLAPIRRRVIEGAAIRKGEVVLDVGAGDGLIAFGALPLVGDRGRVIFSDVSQELLDVSRGLAGELDALDRCEFVLARAEDLGPIADESVDVVTTRSVVIYLKEKQRAFETFHRVLKPGGRLSMFEPINSFAFPEPEKEFMGFDLAPVGDLLRRVKDAENRLSDDATLIDFDERDLLAFADRAGFREIKLTYEAGIEHGAGAHWGGDLSWDSFLRIAPNPLAPSLAETIDDALTPEEAARFVAHMQPLFEGKQGTSRSAVAYLRAVK
ncbi:MAG: class I SAM-dependent methyltransferase [Actinobacteria bacterium]|nr:MAG: class I SAM-dependent methyltransferase [Actinomycetota bacterium]